MPCTVVYLCEFPTLLGGERSLLTLLAHRDPSLIRPVVVAPPEGDLARCLGASALPRLDWPPPGVPMADALAERLKPYCADLVHANSLMTADAARAVARRLDVPAVAHVRDMMKLSTARLRRLAELDAVVAVSSAAADWLATQGLPRERITVIYNAVDVDALRGNVRRGLWRHRLRLGTDQTLVGCIGQIALRKGQDVFLAAAAQLAHRVGDAHFVIAGARYSTKAESRAFEDDLHRRAAAPPLAGRTHFVGYVPDVASLLADLDVLVVPSRQEPLSRTLLEGLAMGVPPVATAVGGTPEILDRPVGLLVPPDDPEALAEAVQRVLADVNCSARARSAGPALVRERFSPAQHIRAVTDLYRALCRKTGLA